MENLGLVEKVAFLYYRDKCSQSKIAKKLKISQGQTSKLLKKAEDEGIVKIIIKPPYTYELEKKVVKHLNLKDARLVFGEKDELLYNKLGLEAAVYFEEVVEDGFTIGISGGRTMTQFVETISSKPRQVTIYPLTMWGGAKFMESVNPSILISILFHKFRPKANCLRYELPPPLIKDEAFKKILEENINKTKIALTKANMILTGVGYLDEMNPFFQLAQSSRIRIGDFKKKGIIGNIFSHLLNSMGQEIGVGEVGLKDHIVELLSLKNLQELSADKNKHVILASGGQNRLAVIKACARTRLFNVLITDYKTAEELLKIEAT